MKHRSHEQSQTLLQRELAAMGSIHRIRFYPLVVDTAQGCTVWDVDGNEYLDFVAGAGVVQTGYGNEVVRTALTEELSRSWSSLHGIFPSRPTIELAERLVQTMPGAAEYAVWFGATGSDANDCVYRVLPSATGRRRFISYAGSYHGQTLGAASLSGHPSHVDLVAGGNVTKAPYPYCYRCLWGQAGADVCHLECLNYIDKYVLTPMVSPPDDTAGLIIEPIQSDGGDIVPPDRYIKALRELLDKHGLCLIFDEVKTGMGRTGSIWSFEHYDVVADVVTAGKPLGGGLPLSAVIAQKRLLNPDVLCLYSLGGSSVPSAGGLATLDELKNRDLLANARRVGTSLLSGLRDLGKAHPSIGDVRGRGLMVGCELVEDRTSKRPAQQLAARVVYRCFELGLMTTYCGVYSNVLEFTPPLVLSLPEVEHALDILDHALTDCEQGRFDDTKLAPYAGW